MTYFVYTPRFSQSVGGIVALHRLASLIAELGRSCFVVSPSTFPESKAQLIQSEYSKENGLDVSRYCEGISMVIYPEGTIGNPLKGDYVTRWILRDTGNDSFGEDDFIFRYHERHNLAFNNGRFDGFLQVALFPTDLLDGKRRRFRWKVRLMIRKESRRVMPLSWFVPVIDPLEENGFEAVVEELSKCFLFINYDTKSGYSHIASYLGALSVIIPNSQTSRRDYHKVYSAKYGIAYGWLDVPFAMFTRKILRQRLRGFPERNKSQVLNYLEIVEGR